ncbi:hypothetical protein BDQ12DRAFT_521843 [Crucibulum laeve]|uniref:LysM domain-containing protein n=1 Tax=Crucibulum laeve TaxID=68775 RepID=A0A5C3LU79_9AGAR|nr:hypothetical protein BDQ12DRAFT_521843 [Crucibulum laeve]
MFTHAFAAATFALFAQSALAGVCSRTYAIKEGDWCDTISANKNVSTYQLAVVNQGIINSECTNLIPGNSICLGNEKEDCSTTYVIKADDSCENIASSHGLNSTILRMNNPQINDDCNNIYIGEVSSRYARICCGGKTGLAGYFRFHH